MSDYWADQDSMAGEFGGERDCGSCGRQGQTPDHIVRCERAAVGYDRAPDLLGPLLESVNAARRKMHAERGKH
jgi:hypothetical protein